MKRKKEIKEERQQQARKERDIFGEQQAEFNRVSERNRGAVSFGKQRVEAELRESNKQRKNKKKRGRNVEADRERSQEKGLPSGSSHDEIDVEDAKHPRPCAPEELKNVCAAAP